MKKFLLYTPTIIALMAIVLFGQGNGDFFGIKAAFGYGTVPYNLYGGGGAAAPAAAAPAAVTAPSAPVVLSPLPANPTLSDMQTSLAAITQQVAYIRTNLTASNVLALLVEVAQRLTEVRSAVATVLPAAAAAPSTAIPPSGSYATPLSAGSTGNDVTALQNFLKSQGTEIYPEGLVTGYFGPLTKSAIQKFQAKYDIVSSGDEVTTGYGFVGPKTRAKINELLGL